MAHPTRTASPRFPAATALCCLLATTCLASVLHGAGADAGRLTLTADFAQPHGPLVPRVGFLGGLRDGLADERILPLHPSLWRIGHQFRGRIAAGLTGAIDRVAALGATYKLVMSDLIASDPKDLAAYEAEVRKLVAQVGTRARSIIWEPVNEPDCAYKAIGIARYYEIYAHAFKALREAEPAAQICGPGFAYPSLEKYRAFLGYCRDHQLECNDLSWHYTGWDPHYPEQAKWGLPQLRELMAAFPAQRITEIHCDEWGAGPDKPGRLFPGLAVVWFYHLDQVYHVDRACRANWGHADDYLGGIVTTAGEPYPVYHAYRWYGSLAGLASVAVGGCTTEIAAFAATGGDRRELLLGSRRREPTTIILELGHLGLADPLVTLQRLSCTHLDQPLAEQDIETLPVQGVPSADGLRVTLDQVQANEAFHVVVRRR